MLCFQAFLGLGMLGIYIQRYIVAIVFYSTFTTLFYRCHVRYVFSVFYFWTFITFMVCVVLSFAIRVYQYYT